MTDLPSGDYLHDVLVRVERGATGSLRRNRFMSLQYHHRPWPKVSADGCWVLRIVQPARDTSFFADVHGWRYVHDRCGRAHWLPLDRVPWPSPDELAGQIELAMMGGSPWLPGTNTWRYQEPPGSGEHTGAGSDDIAGGCAQLFEALSLTIAAVIV